MERQFNRTKPPHPTADLPHLRLSFERSLSNSRTVAKPIWPTPNWNPFARLAHPSLSLRSQKSCSSISMSTTSPSVWQRPVPARRLRSHNFSSISGSSAARVPSATSSARSPVALQPSVSPSVSRRREGSLVAVGVPLGTRSGSNRSSRRTTGQSRTALPVCSCARCRARSWRRLPGGVWTRLPTSSSTKCTSVMSISISCSSSSSACSRNAARRRSRSRLCS